MSAAILVVLVLGALLVTGVPIFIAVGGAGFIGLTAMGQPLSTVAQVFISSVGSFALIAIPLFVFMAEYMTATGIMLRLTNLLAAFVGHWRGGIGYVTVLASAKFAAFSGSSAANAAALSVALIPRMREAGYPMRFAAGVVAAGGTLGILIPPSINMILYSAVTGLPVLQLFRAGIVPGFTLAGAFMVVVAILCRNVPTLPRVPWAARWALVRRDGLLLLLPVVVFGSIFGGIFTVNESAAAGIFFAMLMQSAWFRDFRWDHLHVALVQTAKTTSMIYLIIGTASIFGHVLTLSQTAHDVALAIAPVIHESRWLFFLLAMLLLIVLGTVIDVAAVTYIVIPILDLTVMTNGLDRIQFAIMFIINMEMALIHPPFGLNAFIVSSAAKLTVGEVFLGTIPFCGAMILVMVLVAAFPEMTHWLG